MPSLMPMRSWSCKESNRSPRMWRRRYRLISLNLFWKILTISSCGRPANRRVMLMTSVGTSPVISSSSSAIGLRAGAAATEAATRASDSFTISSRLSLASTSAAAISASSLRRVSSKMRSVCSSVIVNGTCIVAVNSGMEALVLAFWSLLAGGIVASLFGCTGVCEKKSDSNADEEEGEALAAAANDEANRWRKTRRERLMTGDDDEKRKGKRKLYILDFRKSLSIFSFVIYQGVVPFSRDIEPFHSGPLIFGSDHDNLLWLIESSLTGFAWSVAS